MTKFLKEKEYDIIGITRDVSKSSLKNLKYLDIESKITLIEANLLDLSNVIRLMEKNEPDEVYNLAAQSSVGLSFDQPIGTLEFNIISVANILEAIRIVQPRTKFYQASSSEMFGNVRKENLPVNENFIFHPVSPYGISKATAHWATGGATPCWFYFYERNRLLWLKTHFPEIRSRTVVTSVLVSIAREICGSVSIRHPQFLLRRWWSAWPNWLAKIIGIVDYFRGYLGECPSYVRCLRGK